jgi:glycosyltransferase involved in cell wall biosynthesis
LGELKKKGKENFHYYMLGAGNPAALINVAKECGVEDKITFLGQVPHSKVGSVLDEMDVYLQPSLQEGLPRSVVEAMSRGMLCIGARTGAIPELLPEEFIVDRKSVKQIADKLETLDLNTMKNACHQNIMTAGEYEIDKLKSRRDKFFDAIINDMQNSEDGL